MKRNFQGGNERPFDGGKRNRHTEMGFNEALDQGQFQLRLLIPTKVSGALIGKGGENINSMSKKYEASMSVPDKSTPERVLTITAPQAVIMDCFKDLLQIIVQDNRRNSSEIRMLVNQTFVGGIMGKQGSNVKALGEKTATQITIHKEVCPDSTDRCVLIAGAEEKIAEVVSELINLMKETPIRGIERPYDAINYDPHAAKAYGGYTSNRAFEEPMGRRGPPRDRPDPYGRPTPGYHGEPAWGRGGPAPPPPRYHDDGYGRPPMPEPFERRRPPGEMEYQRGGERQHHPSMTYSEDYLRGSEQSTVQMIIPKDLSGKVIGSNGEVITRIQQESGAKVDIGITIVGSPQQIEMAQTLIKQSIRNPAPAPHAVPTQYYVDESLMNARIPDESGLVNRPAGGGGEYYLSENLSEVDNFMKKYNL